MRYKTVYDISVEPYDGWIWFILVGIFAILVLYSFGVLTTVKPGLYSQRYWVVGFAVVIAGIAALSYWDFHRLRDRLLANDCQHLDGIIQGHWEKKWVARDANGKPDWKHYEGFSVNGVSFGYYIKEAEHAGFQNGGPTQILLPDGMPARVWYITDKHIDDGYLENRILKLQLGELPKNR
ncbi:hypothetical protein GGR92_001196 [Spirosoma lacussanchae]|uniref:DUF4229 domain-containing protein n=1 Tax=Spirosoma lacussanchae TaxID=1884249 RepID=UPI001108902A|nr:DUF4229 domain-containing protein [Spirosoma lacussanchae]